MSSVPSVLPSNVACPTDDGDLDCSSIRIEQPDRLTELNARYDDVLVQINALDLRIQGLLLEITGEKTSKLIGQGVPG